MSEVTPFFSNNAQLLNLHGNNTAYSIKALELSPENYGECNTEFRRHTTQAGLLSEAVTSVARACIHSDNLSWLAVGAGLGLCELEVANKLFAECNIKFDAIEPNLNQAHLLEKSCEDLEDNSFGRFKYRVENSLFQDYKSSEQFDFISFIQVLYYFDKLEELFSKSLSLLRSGGAMFIAGPPRNAACEPARILSDLITGKSPTYTDSIWKTLAAQPCKTFGYLAVAYLDISSLFEFGKENSNVMDFLIHARFNALPKGAQLEIESYLRAHSLHLFDGRHVIAHPVEIIAAIKD